MTLPTPVPPLAPDELVSTGGERQVLEAFLDLYRDILKRKLAPAASPRQPATATEPGIVPAATRSRPSLITIDPSAPARSIGRLGRFPRARESPALR